MGTLGLAPSAAASGGGEAAKAPQAIYRDMQEAMRSASFLVIHGQGTYQDGSTVVENTSATPTATHFVTTSNRVPLEQLSVRGATYVRGGNFGTEWILASRDPRCVMAGISQTFDFAHAGTLTKGAVTTLGRKRVIEIDDDGKAPNATPKRVSVSLDGAPLPVRVVTTGAMTPGPTECPLDAIMANPLVSGTEDWSFNGHAAAIPTPKPFIDGSVGLLAQATYTPAANLFSAMLTNLNNQFGQITDLAAAQANFQQTADLFKGFAGTLSAIKFPGSVQGQAQNLINLANTIATDTANNAAAAGQGDPNVVTMFNQQQSQFDAAQNTFATQLQQAL